MTMNYAIVENGIVINVTIWDGEAPWQPPEGCDLVPLQNGAGIGWGYVDGSFVAPEIPEAVE